MKSNNSQHNRINPADQWLPIMLLSLAAWTQMTVPPTCCITPSPLLHMIKVQGIAWGFFAVLTHQASWRLHSAKNCFLIFSFYK